MASNEAFQKQAEGASAAAKKYMEENELLQEVTPTCRRSHTHVANCFIIPYKVTEKHWANRSGAAVRLNEPWLQFTPVSRRWQSVLWDVCVD